MQNEVAEEFKPVHPVLHLHQLLFVLVMQVNVFLPPFCQDPVGDSHHVIGQVGVKIVFSLLFYGLAGPVNDDGPEWNRKDH